MMHEAARYVFSLVNRLSKFAKKEFGGDEFGVDPAVMGMIFAPGEDGSPQRIRMTDLSRRMMISKPAATQAINRLVENGLAERIRDEEDRRVVYIQATSNGQALFEEKLNERLAVIDQAIERVGLDKAQQLGALLDEFVDALVEVSAE